MTLSPLPYTLKKATNERKNQTILYFHGGGLLYGNRDDLPNAYQELFLTNGYDLLMIDYPLAPEASFTKILGDSAQFVEWFLAHYQELELSSQEYILFGRSAGAFLALAITKQNPSISPLKVIDFYGYLRLDQSEFAVPNAHYSNYPKVTEEQIQKIIQPTIQYGSPIAERLPLYLYARQTGNWLDLLNVCEEDLALLAVTKENVADFPPIFICHATEDPDVPFKEALFLKRMLPQTTLVSVPEKSHDFDQQVTQESLAIYQKVIEWLN